MRREHRRELKHDRFVDEIGSSLAMARENRRLLLLAGLAVIALAAIAYAFFYYRHSREGRAQQALAVAVETIESPLIPPPGGAQPPPGAKYKTEAERNAAAEKQFKEVDKKFDGTDAADVARLYIARFNAGRGDVSGARKQLEQFLAQHPKHMLVGSVRFSLYQLRIENGESAKVADELQAEINKTDPVLPADTLLMLLAHAYDAQGSGEKSKAAYRRIVTEFPDSPYALEAQRRVGPA
jgi:TolA-binding protein